MGLDNWGGVAHRTCGHRLLCDPDTLIYEVRTVSDSLLHCSYGELASSVLPVQVERDRCVFLTHCVACQHCQGEDYQKLLRKFRSRIRVLVPQPLPPLRRGVCVPRRRDQRGSCHNNRCHGPLLTVGLGALSVRQGPRGAPLLPLPLRRGPLYDRRWPPARVPRRGPHKVACHRGLCSATSPLSARAASSHPSPLTPRSPRRRVHHQVHARRPPQARRGPSARLGARLPHLGGPRRLAPREPRLRRPLTPRGFHRRNLGACAEPETPSEKTKAREPTRSLTHSWSPLLWTAQCVALAVRTDPALWPGFAPLRCPPPPSRLARGVTTRGRLRRCTGGTFWTSSQPRRGSEARPGGVSD